MEFWKQRSRGSVGICRSLLRNITGWFGTSRVPYLSLIFLLRYIVGSPLFLVTHGPNSTDTQTDEIIDVDVYKKRRREEVLRRRVRPRVDDVRPAPANTPDSSNEPMADTLTQ